MRFVKLAIILAFMAVTSFSYAVGREGIVLNVLNGEQLLKELGGEVALPFETEYKLRLKNVNDRRATAKVFIDGIEVSRMGDFVIPANGTIDLERFVDRSLREGKRFKFVSVNHPEVNDPYSEVNGEVRVEVRFEKRVPEIKLIYPPPYKWGGITFSPNGTIIIDSSTLTFDSSNTLDSFASTSINCSAGATIGGSYSDQAFHKIWFEVEESKVELRLKLVGMNL